jgi:NADPH2:quinone reductase
LKRCAIVGVFWGDFVRREPGNSGTDLKDLVDLYQKSKIKSLVSGRYSLEQTGDALHALMQCERHGKIVVAP